MQPDAVMYKLVGGRVWSLSFVLLVESERRDDSEL